MSNENTLCYVWWLKAWGDMAPKRCYDAGRLGEAAEEAAKRAQAAHDDDVTLTCSYGGVVGGNALKMAAMVFHGGPCLANSMRSTPCTSFVTMLVGRGSLCQGL